MGIHLSAGGVHNSIALTALAQLSERWGVPKSKRHLLIGAPASTVSHWYTKLNKGTADDSEPLDATTMERISHLVAIYDGLHRLVPSSADAWMNRENLAFGGRKPLDVILSGQVVDLINVRQYVDRVLHQ